MLRKNRFADVYQSSFIFGTIFFGAAMGFFLKTSFLCLVRQNFTERIIFYNWKKNDGDNSNIYSN